eukprot:g40545.t1
MTRASRHRWKRGRTEHYRLKKLAYADDSCNNDGDNDEKRIDSNIMAARKKEIDGLYEAKCVQWASREDARRADIAPIHTGFVDAIKNPQSVRNNDACGSSLDASTALCDHGWTVYASAVFAIPPDDFKSKTTPGRRWHDHVARQRQIFPPVFVNDPTSLPWYENLKRKLDENKFRYKAMGDVKWSLPKLIG